MKKKIRVVLSVFILNTLSFPQVQSFSIETPSISAGAEFNLLIQEKIRKGEDANINVRNLPISLQKSESTTLITTYEGINFDQNATLNGSYFIPPDPIGAAGPNHLVSVVNCAIEWFTKAGVKQNSQRLGRNSGGIVGSFFATLGPLTATFDPKVIYDQYNGRFIVITMEQQSSPQASRILVAVSQTSDPNAGWYFHSINSLINIGGNSWADYPGLAIGTDAIYITANMFRFSGGGYAGGRLWIIAKSPFYSGGAASVNVYDHITLATGNKYSSTYQPAHMFGTPQTNVGTFLILYSGLSDGTNESVNVIRVDNPLTSPSFTGQNISQGNVDNTTGAYNNAPQLGTATLIATNDRRSLNAVWRNNSLWSVFCIVPPSGVDAGQVTAHWVRVNTTTLSSLTLTDQGNIGGESIATGCYTFFPSIAVNSSNDACIGFSASASTIYPGAYYTGRVSSDPLGYTINPDSVRRGRDYYIRTFGSGSNRWGDYSGASVDPSNDQTFYVFNQYALTRGTIFGGEDGRWGTAFGIVPVSVLPVELSLFTAKVLRSGGVQLNWRTETEVSNFGFDVERLQDYNIEKLQDWEKIGFVEGSGNSNSPKDYSFTDNVMGGKYSYRLKQIDTDGQFEYSKVIEVDAGNIPGGFVLEQNYPNPFNPTTTIKFAVAETQKAELKVFDMLGNEVAALFNGIAEGGKVYEQELNGESLSSGIYFYRLATDNRVENRKMILIK